MTQTYASNNSMYKYNPSTDEIICVEPSEAGKINYTRIYKDLLNNYYLIPLNNNYSTKYIYKYNTETNLFDIKITDSSGVISKIIVNPDYPNIIIFWITAYVFVFDTNTNTLLQKYLMQSSNVFDLYGNYLITYNKLFFNTAFKDYDQFLSVCDKYRDEANSE